MNFKTSIRFCRHFRGSAHQHYVATGFRLLVGILRVKDLPSCKFLETEVFKGFKNDVGCFGFEKYVEESGKNELDSADSIDVASTKKRKLEQDAQEGPSTPPNATSKPARKIPPKLAREMPPKSTSQPQSNHSKLILCTQFRCSITAIESDKNISPETKKRKLREKVTSVLGEINDICQNSNESLGHILGECCALPRSGELGARKAIQSAFGIMCKKNGVKNAFDSLIPEQSWNMRVKSMRAPDWIFLLIKLKSRISDDSWQHLTSLTKLGRTKVSIYK